MIWLFLGPVALALWAGLIYGCYLAWHFRPRREPELSSEQMKDKAEFLKIETANIEAKMKQRRGY